MPRSTTLLESRAQLKAMRRYVKGIAVDKVKRLGLNIMNNLHNPAYVPVDTGWLLANSVVGVGVPPDHVIGTRKEAEANKAANIDIGDTGLETDIRNGVKDLLEYDHNDLGKTIYIANNVPYAVIVNTIHKSRAGFWERAIEDAVEALE